MQRTIDHNDTNQKKREEKNTVKNKLDEWVATKLYWPTMLLTRLNNLSKYVFNIKYLHGQLH